MDCERVREEFVERLTGSLDSGRSRAIDEHIAGCAACRAETDRMRELWTELGALTVPAASGASARVERMIDARSRQLSNSGSAAPPRASPLPRAAITAIGLAASLLVGVMLGRGSGGGSGNTAAAPITPGGTPTATSTAAKERYVLLLHGPARNRSTAADAAADSANEQALVAEYSAWAGRLAGEGKLLAGEKLADDPLTMLVSTNQQLFLALKDTAGGNLELNEYEGIVIWSVTNAPVASVARGGAGAVVSGREPGSTRVIARVDQRTIGKPDIADTVAFFSSKQV